MSGPAAGVLLPRCRSDEADFRLTRSELAKELWFRLTRSIYLWLVEVLTDQF